MERVIVVCANVCAEHPAVPHRADVERVSLRNIDFDGEWRTDRRAVHGLLFTVLATGAEPGRDGMSLGARWPWGRLRARLRLRRLLGFDRRRHVGHRLASDHEVGRLGAFD